MVDRGLRPYMVTAQNPNLNILLYGRPGAGKTSLAATAQDHPAMKDVLFLDIEGGLLSVAGRGDIQALRIESADDLEEVFWALVNRDPVFRSVKTIVVDSATELVNINLEAIVRRAKERNRGRSLNDVHIEDYGQNNTHLKRLFRGFKDLGQQVGINVIITALMKETMPRGSDGGDPIDVGPAMSPGLAESVMAYMDFVWYMYSDEEGRKLLTSPVGVFRAKTRGPRFEQELNGVVVNPHLGELYDLLVACETGQLPPREEGEIEFPEDVALPEADGDSEIVETVAEHEYPGEEDLGDAAPAETTVPTRRSSGVPARRR